LRGLTDILGDLRAWTQRREPEGFVLPQVYHDGDTRRQKREALTRGVEGALEAVDHLTPESCVELDGDAAEAFGLAVILQVYEFFRSGGWDAIDDDDLSWTFARLEYAQCLTEPLTEQLNDPEDESDRRAVAAKLESTVKHLNQVVKEGKAVMENRGVEPDPDDFGSLPSFDPVPDQHDAPKSTTLTAAAPPTQETVEEAIGESTRQQQDQHQRREAKIEASSRLRERVRYAGLAMIPLLVALAVYSLWPFLTAKTTPRVDDYSDILPVHFVSRIGGEAPYTVFVVAEDWEQQDSDQRLVDLQTLYGRASVMESTTSIVIRDTDGLDLARVDNGAPVLLQ